PSLPEPQPGGLPNPSKKRSYEVRQRIGASRRWTLPVTFRRPKHSPSKSKSKFCWQNFVDYHKCVKARGKDYLPCGQFRIAYYQLCPDFWICTHSKFLTALLVAIPCIISLRLQIEYLDDQMSRGTFLYDFDK
ncbi:MAG: hypothetical protein BJ554DRAFT_5897, partial [Olpidium bornovanus]